MSEESKFKLVSEPNEYNIFEYTSNTSWRVREGRHPMGFYTYQIFFNDTEISKDIQSLITAFKDCESLSEHIEGPSND